MQFEIERTEFIRALESANKATAGKETPILGNIYVRAEAEKIQIAGYDLATAIFTEVPARVAEAGEACFPADTVSKFLSKCGDAWTNISTDEKLTVKCGRSKVSAAVAPAEDYPLPERLSAEAQEFYIDNNLLTALLKKTMFAASQDSVRPELKCVNLAISDGKITVTAGDGYRVAVCTQEAEYISKLGKASFNLFRENLQTALAVLRTPRITVRYDKRNIEFSDDVGTSVIMSVCANEYPDFPSRIKKYENSVKQRITLKSEDLYETLQRIAALPKSLTVPVVFNFGIDTATITYGSGFADLVDKLDCKTEGDPFAIGLNLKFLTDAVKNAEGDVTFCCNGSAGPVIFESAGAKNMIMPMRLKR